MLFSLIFALLSSVQIAAKPVLISKPNPSENCKYHMGCIALDYSTGAVLYYENLNTPLYPASLTKMMTIYVALLCVKLQKDYLHKHFLASQFAVRQEPSKLGLRLNERISLFHALHAVAIRSCNDAAEVITQLVGSREVFLLHMNWMARSMHLESTTFFTPSGLHHAQQKSCVRDMGILAWNLYRHFPQYNFLYNKKHFKWQRFNIKSTNKLLGTHVVSGTRVVIDGLKTGYTSLAKHNIFVTCLIKDKRYIIGVMNARKSAERQQKVLEIIARIIKKQFMPNAVKLPNISLNTMVKEYTKLRSLSYKQ